MHVVSSSCPGEVELEANFGLHVWAPNTGTVLASFKHANVTLHGLSLLGRDHMVAAQAHRAGIHIWDWRKEVPQIRCTPPERVGPIAASPSGVYCAAAGTTSGKVYLWQVSNGRLMRSWDAHYRAVTSLCFSDDSVFLYTGGEDALVKCWNLADLFAVRLTTQSALSNYDDQDAKAVHSYTGHTLPVTALRIGRGGFAARIFSASLDRTVKVYELSGARDLIASMAFPSAVHAIATDPSERFVFAGLADGSIHRAVLAPTARVGPHQNTGDAPSSLIFYGHKMSVTALCVSPDETFLVSGSADGTCKVWHINSAQMLVNFDKHKGEITDLKIFLSPSETNFALADADELTAENSAFGLPIAPFQKYSEASSITNATTTAGNRTNTGDENSVISTTKNTVPQELLDGDVIVNLYSNKKKSKKSAAEVEFDEVEKLRLQYWKALPSSSKGEQDEKLLRKAKKYLKSAEDAKPKEIALHDQVGKLQAELDAAREQNTKWQEINNQMYRHMFRVLREEAGPPPAMNNK